MIELNRTVPATPSGGLDTDDESTILGFPVESDADDEPEAPEDAPALPRLVVLRRPDRLAGSALVVAGAAANASLWLPWVAGEPQTGMTLFRRGLDLLDLGAGALLRSELWQPVAVVAGGGVLVVLGLLLFVPAHTHRFLGVLALVVALAAAAAVLTLLAGTDWSAARFGAGLWCGIAVAGSGLLGALRAMLRLPRVTTERDGQLRR